jgi:signal peptidase I
VTVGPYDSHDYGRDYQTYPPYPADAEDQSQDGYARRGAEAPTAGYPSQPAYPQQSGYPSYPSQGGYPQAGYPQSGYPQSGYPENGGNSGGEYPPNGYRAADYRQAGYPEPAYPDHPSYQPEPDYPTATYRAVERPGRPELAATPASPAAQPWDPWDGPRPANGRPVRRLPADTRVTTASRAGGGPGDPGTGSGRRKRKGLPLWQELPLLLIIAFCLAILVRTFLLQAFYIPSGSMEDTLIAGDRVLVNKVVYNFREPARGEVVVFRGTDAWAPENIEDGNIGAFAKIGQALGDLVGVSRPGEKDFIKRVIGLPGDTVSCCDVDGRVFVNGQPLDESYVIRDSPLDEGAAAGVQDCRSRRFDEVVVQPGQIFVMGDHRQVSQDSRCQGQVPIDNIIGRAFIIVWPNDRWNALSQPATFDNVPGPAAAAGPGPSTGATGAGAESIFVLPFLLPLARLFSDGSARSRHSRRRPTRRLA